MIRTQNWRRRMNGLIGCVVALMAVNLRAESNPSTWVYPGPDGRLVYQATPSGDRIMDFSTAGYEGGGVPLPVVPVRQTVQPSGGPDDTRSIQAAIDAVAALPLQNGFRGAVLMAPGTYSCSNTVFLPASGVVLRGSEISGQNA